MYHTPKVAQVWNKTNKPKNMSKNTQKQTESLIISKEEYLRIKIEYSTTWIEKFDAVCYEIENISKLYNTLKPSEFKSMVFSWLKFLPLAQWHSDYERNEKLTLLSKIAEKEIKPQKEVIYDIFSIPNPKNQ